MIEPYRTDDMGLLEVQDLVSLAATGWNLSIFPDGEREEALNRALASLPFEARPQTRRLVLEMAERKIALFPDDCRFLAHQKVIEEKDSFRVLAASLSNSSREP